MDKNISIRFFDKDINFLGEVDYYTSLFYIRRWETFGEFEFHIPKYSGDLIKKGNIIMLNNDSSRVGVIEHIEINEVDSEDITVKGYSLLYLLSQRITIPPEGKAYHTFNTNAEDIILAIIKSNAIDPQDKNRIIPNLELEKSKSRGIKIEFQTRYKNLLDELNALSKTSGLGISIELDKKRKKLVFKVNEGLDLTYSQKYNSPVIFAAEYDNIRKQNYIDSSVGHKNCGYIAGQGEGAERQVEVLNSNLKGLDRRETFVDARDVDENRSLQDRGKIKLSETPIINSLECEVNPKDYKLLWNLGDKVTIVSKRYGIKLDSVVYEVKEIYESSGFKVEPTFGTPIPLVTDKIKQITDTPLNENIKGDPGETGEQGIQGYSIQYNWSGTSLGVKREDETSYNYVNLKGSAGNTGATGAQGIQGIKGDTGVQGVQGQQGVKGDIGATGPQGPKGDKGIQGPVGSTQSYILFHQHFVANASQTLFEWNDGYTYPLNVNAIRVYLNGVRLSNRIINQIRGNAIQFKTPLNEGDKVFIEAYQMVLDLQGPKGDTGATGPKGDTGEKGATGPQGIKGDTGEIGPQGIKGDTGLTGATGSRGDIWRPTVDSSGNLTWAINNGSTTPTSINIRGPQGIQGIQGATGQKGATGNTGATGSQGVQGPKGDQGTQGVQGPAGNGQSYVVFHRHFVANAAQKIFSWNDGYVYPIGINAIAVYLNGARLTNRIFTETSGSSIEFKVALNEGDRVFIEAMQAVVDLQGPQGIQGPKGDKGATGTTGAKGDTGTKGDTWRPTVDSNGNITWILNNGTTTPVAQNIRGPQGIQGAKGDTGATGAQGIQGIQGVKGDTGAKGATGSTGPKGDIGSQGVQGPKGDQGIQGIQGAKGDVGAKGATGSTGSTGAKGDTGGVWRPTVDASGNLTWALNSSGTTPTAINIKGPQGLKGDVGAKGATGSQGAIGPAGATGAKGATGNTGATGPQGQAGKDGTQIITSSTRPSGQVNGRVWIQLT